MKQEKLTVVSNRKLNSSTYEMILSGVTEDMFPGQFVEVKLPGKYLRRPFSVADYENGFLTLLYKVVGGGTDQMTKVNKGEVFDVLTGLGNTFNLELTKNPVLVGGGIGVAPMYGLCKAFSKINVKPTVVLGFRNKDEIFYLEEFEKIANVIVATDDGSVGLKGNSLNGLKTLDNVDFYYACGPMVMLKALSGYSKNGQLSLEARMGCGFGACMGCSIKTVSGYKRVCKEGPVFMADEVIYE